MAAFLAVLTNGRGYLLIFVFNLLYWWDAIMTASKILHDSTSKINQFSCRLLLIYSYLQWKRAHHSQSTVYFVFPKASLSIVQQIDCTLGRLDSQKNENPFFLFLKGATTHALLLIWYSSRHSVVCSKAISLMSYSQEECRWSDVILFDIVHSPALDSLAPQDLTAKLQI